MDVTIEIDKEYEELRKSFKFSNRKICDIDVGEELWHYKESSNDLEVQLNSINIIIIILIISVLNIIL